MRDVAKRLQEINWRLREACKKAGRESSSVKLLAVSKKFPSSVVRLAVEAGHSYFGENYVQEARDKIEELKSSGFKDLTFDLIGPLQRNKAKIAVGLFELIHSVDRIELAREISKQAEKKGITQKILIQVNISTEDSKSGVLPEELSDLAKEVIQLPSISLQGLMSIGSVPASEFSTECGGDPSTSSGRTASSSPVLCEEFTTMRLLRDQLSTSLSMPLPELSMGMSHDFELAIEYGATIVRVGSAIFGERI